MMNIIYYGYKIRVVLLQLRRKSIVKHSLKVK